MISAPRLLVVFLVAFYISGVFGQYYNPTIDKANRDKYYKSVAVNYDSLHQLLQNTHIHEYDYDTARKVYLYPTVDRHPDGKLHGIYTDIVFDDNAVDNDSNPLTQRKEEIDYNCEHAVPQSWFNEGNPMKGDLHHLYTAEVACNSFRGNYPFAQNYPLSKDRPGCGDQLKATPLRFFPDHGKGPVARSTLYFLVRYPGYITNADFPQVDLPTVIQWAVEQPITEWELHRNFEIAAVQGDRNPFIDYPSWAQQIDFKKGYGSS